MCKKRLSFVLIGLLLNLCFLNSTALAGNKEEKLISKVKSGIVKMGIGKDSKIAVKLKDNTKIKGYISNVSESGFTVIESETNIEKNVSFDQVKQVKGNNLSKGVKIAIGIGIAVILLIIIGIATGGEINII